MIGIGSPQFVVACFAGTMIVVSAIGLLERALSPYSVAERYATAVILAGWVLLGTLGLGIVGQLLAGSVVPVGVAFTGFVTTLAWLFVEQSVIGQSDRRATPLGRWLVTQLSDRPK